MEQRYTPENILDIQSITKFYLEQTAKSSPDLYPQILRIKLTKPIFGNQIAFSNTQLKGSA